MNTARSELAAGGSYMTFEQVLAELQIARSTLDGWRRKRLFPAFTRLPNGQLRLKRIDFVAWVDKQRKAA
jgi:predicted DNA-binding transcriptional regulator AlpA